MDDVPKISFSSSAPYIVPVCMRQAGINGNNTGTIWRQPALLRTLPRCLIPSGPSDFTGTIKAGSRRYSTGTIEGLLLHRSLDAFIEINKTTQLRHGGFR